MTDQTFNTTLRELADILGLSPQPEGEAALRGFLVENDLEVVFTRDEETEAIEVAALIRENVDFAADVETVANALQINADPVTLPKGAMTCDLDRGSLNLVRTLGDDVLTASDFCAALGEITDDAMRVRELLDIAPE